MTPESPRGSDEDLTAGSGSSSFLGYLYQAKVSVYVALELLLNTKRAHSITVEPATEEDIEAEIEGDPPSSAVDAHLGTYNIVVQVKHRGSGPWGVRSLLTLLTKEREKRITPKERLSDKSVRYLLITNAAATGEATALRVNAVGLWPVPSALPALIKTALGEDAGGRIALYSQLEQNILELYVKTLLVDGFKVPFSKWSACYCDLLEDATNRMVGRASNVWTRDAVESIVRRFDGYLTSSPELAFYVRPVNWGDICRHLEERHAVVLRGSSGTGKTMTVEALWDHLQQTAGGFVRIKVDPARGSRDVTEYRGKDPAFFDIEDPWGRFKFEEQLAQWNEVLPHLLRTASANRKFVITSRSDVFHDADGPGSLAKWTVALEAESYSSLDRRGFYDKKTVQFPRPFQHLALRHRDIVLRALPTLYELQKFFDFLSETEVETTAAAGAARVREAIEESRIEAIEKTIRKQIEARAARNWAYVLWGVFKANRTISWDTLHALHAALAEESDQYDSGLRELVTFMVAGRNLRQSEEVLSYYHPRVESALQSLVEQNVVSAGKALVHLVDAFIKLDRTDAANDSGRASAARVMQAATKVNNLILRLAPATTKVVDEWLSDRLGANVQRYDHLLELTSSAGSKSWEPTRFANYLVDLATVPLFRIRRGQKRFIPSEEWLHQIAAHSLTRCMAQRFVTQVLPSSNVDYHKDVVRVLTEVAGDLTPFFIAAAKSIVNRGIVTTWDVILEGATKDLEALWPIAHEAMAFAQSVEYLPEVMLAIENGEYSEDDLEQKGEQLGEKIYAAQQIAIAYVSARRQQGGWASLAEHNDNELLLGWWLSAVRKAKDDDEAREDEWLELCQRAVGSKHESLLWDAANEKWNSYVLGTLVSRLESPASVREVRLSAEQCALSHVPGAISGVVTAFLASGEVTRAFELLSDLAHLSAEHGNEMPSTRVLQELQSVLSPDLVEFAELLLGAAEPTSWNVSESAQALAGAIGESSEDATLV